VRQDGEQQSSAASGLCYGHREALIIAGWVIIGGSIPMQKMVSAPSVVVF
jgi:hypothetical protein